MGRPSGNLLGARRRASSVDRATGCQGLADVSHPRNRTENAMLWTILIILAIIALVLFILGRARGRGV